MTPVKALYITNLGLLDNLAETQVLPYLEGLAKGGFAAEILSFEKKENLRDAAAVYRIKKRLSDSGIGWRYLTYHRRWGNIWDVAAGSAKGLQVILKERVGILHARASIPILIAWPLAKLLGLKVVYDRRGTMSGDLIDDVNIRNVFSVGGFARMIDAFEGFIMRHSDAVIVLSEKALGLLGKDPGLSRSGTAIEAIPCCVDLSRFGVLKETDPGAGFTMCYLGSLGTCYLLKEMADFFKELRKKKPGAVFFIISHTDKSYIEGVLRKEGLQPGDFRIISLRPDEVGRYLSQCEFGIMFIKPVECKIGSSPTKFAESLASGMPVIVNRGIGDTEDIIRQRRVGVVVEGFDRDSYGKAVCDMLSLLGEDGLRERCIDTARRYFSLDMGIGRYLNVYRKITTDR